MPNSDEQVERPTHGMRWFWLVTILGAAFALRTNHLTDVSLWFDEACSARISQFPVPEMLDAVSRDAHPPLFYFLLKGWEAVFGTGVLALRGLSVLLGLAGVTAAWWFGATAATVDHGSRENAVRRTWMLPALMATLVACSPLHVDQSLQARPYTLGVCLSLLAGTWLLRAASPCGRWSDWCGFAVSGAALSMTHYYALFTLAGLGMFLVVETVWSLLATGWGPRSQRLVLGMGLSFAAVTLVWLPWVEVFAWQRTRADAQLWMSPLTAYQFSRICWQTLTAQSTAEFHEVAAWIAVAVWGLVTLGLMLSPHRAERLAGFCSGVPWVGSLAYSLGVRNILEPRYLIFAETYFLMGLGLLIQRPPRRVWRWILAGSVVAWSGWWCWELRTHREELAKFSGMRSAAAYLDEARDGDEPVIVGSPFVFTTLIVSMARPGDVFTLYNGDHRSDLLAGPPLRQSDYEGVEQQFHAGHSRIWTVDVSEHFGGTRIVPVPETYALVSERRFEERFGHRANLVVREYRHVSDSASVLEN